MVALVNYRQDLDDWYFKTKQLFHCVRSQTRSIRERWMNEAVSEKWQHGNFDDNVGEK